MNKGTWFAAVLLAASALHCGEEKSGSCSTFKDGVLLFCNDYIQGGVPASQLERVCPLHGGAYSPADCSDVNRVGRCLGYSNPNGAMGGLWISVSHSYAPTYTTEMAKQSCLSHPPPTCRQCPTYFFEPN